jgi:hypothetical protein
VRSEDTYAVPRSSRWLIEFAALLAPPGLRKDWKREWLGELWYGYETLRRAGASYPRAWRRVTGFALGAFIDASDLRMERLRLRADRRSLVRHPAFCLASLLVLFLSIGGWTGGFRHVRAAFAFDYPGADQLVLLSRPLGVLGMQVPANGEQVSTWVESSKWFGDVAGFVLRRDTLEVTPNFFSVLHVEPSPDFRFLGHSVRTVKTLDGARLPAHYSGALARLKHPQDRKAAEAHFATFSILEGAHVNATFLQQRDRWPLYFAGVVSALFLAAGLLRIRRPSRYVAFFVGKTAVLLALVAACWAEIATALPIPITGGIDAGTATPLIFLFLVGEAFVLRWSLDDQASRCPVCCRLVSMPVTVGSRSSLILDRPGVQFLCLRGHGTLLLSDLRACTGERSRWTPADRSWHDVFVQEKAV